MQRERGENGVLDRRAIDGGQTAGHSQTHGTNVRVGRRAGIIRRTAAKHFAAREQLRVHFQTNHRFEFHFILAVANYNTSVSLGEIGKW